MYKLAPRSKTRIVNHSGLFAHSKPTIINTLKIYFIPIAEIETCFQSKLEKYQSEIKSINIVVNEEYASNLNEIKNLKNNLETKQSDVDESNKLSDESNEGEHVFMPYAGNGYIGLSLFSKNGLFSYHQKSVNLKLNYNPLAQIYSDILPSKGVF